MHKHRVIICDDSARERQRFYERQWDNFTIDGVTKIDGRYVEDYPIDSVDKLHRRILSLRQQARLPDLVLLDLFYKRPLADVDEVERRFVDELLAVKEEYLRLKRKAQEYLIPSGIEVLRQIREVDKITADELPIAVYTDKNFNFLSSDDFNLLYRLDAGTVHKDRDDDPLLQITSSAEYFRLLHTIERHRASKSRSTRIFLSHGPGDVWIKVQLFLEKEAHLSTLELAQSPNGGRTVIEKLEQSTKKCSHAIIVMTRDVFINGIPQVRENVMHEVGFCQARMGLDRVILLHEDGVNMPSNLGGLVYVPFKHGGVETTFARLLIELQPSKERT